MVAVNDMRLSVSSLPNIEPSVGWTEENKRGLFSDQWPMGKVALLARSSKRSKGARNGGAENILKKVWYHSRGRVRQNMPEISFTVQISTTLRPRRTGLELSPTAADQRDNIECLCTAKASGYATMTGSGPPMQSIVSTHGGDSYPGCMATILKDESDPK